MICINKMCSAQPKGYNGATLLIMKEGEVEHVWICNSCLGSLKRKDVRFAEKAFIQELVDILEKEDTGLALHKAKTALGMFDE